MAIAVILTPTGSMAADKLFLTGAELTDARTSYLYAGTALPLPGSNMGKGLVFHLWADYLTYSYNAGPTEIDAFVHSLSASLGYHDSGTGYWWNTRAGIVQTDTHLSPEDPGNVTLGLKTGLKLQAEGEKQLTEDSKINGIVDFITSRSAYWTRVRYLMKNTGGSYHGPEFIAQGDPHYTAQQLGWAISGIHLGRRLGIGLKAGMRLDNGNDTSGYIGVELSALY